MQGKSLTILPQAKVTKLYYCHEGLFILFVSFLSIKDTLGIISCLLIILKVQN